MADIDGFVLAGGRSRRMGTDKARVAWGDVPLAVAVARSLRVCCRRVALIRRGDDGLPWIDEEDQPIEVICEQILGEPHPLWGIYTALREARTDLVLVAPCDTPSLGAHSLARLIEHAPSVASDGARLFPLVAVLPRQMADAARALATAGAPAHHLVRSVHSVVFPAHELRDHDDPESLGCDPIAQLLAAIPITDPEQSERIARGERVRLRARGIVPPDGSR